MKSVSYLLEIKDKFSASMGRFSKSVSTASAKVHLLNGKLSKLKNTQEGLFSLAGGNKYAAFAAGYFITKSFADFETAMFKIAKTANIEVGPSLDNMGRKFKLLSEDMPNTAEQLALVGASAAQLGVRGEGNILKFAKTMGMLQSATDVYGEEGASQMARLVNVVGGNINDIDRYASALTHLGNTSAATEREILRFAMDMASRSQAFNMSGQDAMGLAAAFKSVGLQSELASGAVSRVLGVMNEAVYSGGDALVIMSAISGKTRDELKSAFEADAVGALVQLGASIDDMEKKGVNLTRALNYLGLEGIRDKVVMTTLAKKIDLVKKSMAESNKEFGLNKALSREYEIQQASLANKLRKFWGSLKLVAIAFFDTFDDRIKGFVDNLTARLINFSKQIEKMDGDLKLLENLLKHHIVEAFEFVRPYIQKFINEISEMIGNSIKQAVRDFISINNIMKGLKVWGNLITGGNKNVAGDYSMFDISRPQYQPIELNGNITVSADKESKVSSSVFDIYGGRGRILQTVGVVQ